MNQPPKDLVSPDELVEYIRSRNVSENSATGLKLMRRAAETIAYLNDERGAELNEAADEKITDMLDQVAHALGADFHEKHAAYGLNEILQHIDDLHVQLVGLKDGIIQRDNVIKQYEEPVNATGSASGIEIKFADHGADDSYVGEMKSTGDDQSVGCGDTMDRHEWIKEATNFAHKVHGATLVMDDANVGTRYLRDTAEHLIEKSPAN